LLDRRILRPTGNY